MKEIRPWGAYTIVGTDPLFQIKKITVNPGHQTSLQSHEKRSEHWIVVSGVATVTLAHQTITLKEQETIFIKAKVAFPTKEWHLSFSSKCKRVPISVKMILRALKMIMDGMLIPTPRPCERRRRRSAAIFKNHAQKRHGIATRRLRRRSQIRLRSVREGG